MNTETSNDQEMNLRKQNDENEDEKIDSLRKKRLDVNVGMTVYESGHFDLTTGTIDIMMDLWLTYDAKHFDTLYNRKVLPWTLSNALALDVAANENWEIWGTSLDNLNYWIQKPGEKPDVKENDANSDMKLFRVELYTMRMSLKFRTFQGEDPFQRIYAMLIFALDGSPGSEMTDFHHLPKGCFFPGFRKKIGDFTLKSQIIRNYEVEVDYGKYSRLYFIFEYKKSPWQDVFKYYLVPSFILGLTVLFHHTVDSLFDSLGAYFLATVALMFTLPETGVFTRNERAVVYGSMLMLIMLLVLVQWPDNKRNEIILGLVVGISYPILIIFDWISSSKRNEKIRHILYEGDLGCLDSL